MWPFGKSIDRQVFEAGLSREAATDWSDPDIILPDDWTGRDEGVSPPWGWERQRAEYGE